MAFPDNHVRITYLHQIFGTEEVAETAVNIHTGGGTSAVDFVDVCRADATKQSGMNSQYTTFLGANANSIGFAAYGRVVGNKVAAIGTDGKYLSDPSVWVNGSPYGGGKSGVPAQCSVVLSLRTGSNFGLANKGRLYIPYTMPNLSGSTALMSTTIAQQIADAADAWFTQLNTTVDLIVSGARLAIYSSKGAGDWNLPSSVRVGTVIDTQRRRRNRLGETYASAVI